MKGKEIYISEKTGEDELIGKYAWNDNWKIGGIITEVTDNGVAIGGSWYSTITGSCPYDSLTINGFKVYENITKE